MHRSSNGRWSIFSCSKCFDRVWISFGGLSLGLVLECCLEGMLRMGGLHRWRELEEQAFAHCSCLEVRWPLRARKELLGQLQQSWGHVEAQAFLLMKLLEVSSHQSTGLYLKLSTYLEC